MDNFARRRAHRERLVRLAAVIIADMTAKMSAARLLAVDFSQLLLVFGWLEPFVGDDPFRRRGAGRLAGAPPRFSSGSELRGDAFPLYHKQATERVSDLLKL